MFCECRRVGSSVAYVDGVVEVQLARTPVIVQPISDVGVLLELQQRDAGADGMDRPGGNEEKIAGGDRTPIDELLDRAVERGAAQLLGRNLALEPETDG